MPEIDALLLVSFGGPEGPDDVLPFLENVTRGRNVPAERLQLVAEQYSLFGGVSPINGQNRRLQLALRESLLAAGLDLPVYWGNRNWTPFLNDTVATMAADGITNALAIATSAYSSYSGCRQYLDDIDQARAAVGDAAPNISKARPYFDHPGFIEPFRDSVVDAAAGLGDDAPIVFTAHSIPLAMAAGCDYESQLQAAAKLISEALPGRPWTLAWQSRSGPPTVPWLTPDINDELRNLASDGHTEVVIAPIGFVSDHMEVMYDLDHQAAATARDLGMTVRRATTPGTAPDPRFVSMWRSIVQNHLAAEAPTQLSALPQRPFPCAAGCCFAS